MEVTALARSSTRRPRIAAGSATDRDPTRSQSLRARWMGEVGRRFAKFAARIRRAVLEDNLLGYEEPRRGSARIALAPVVHVEDIKQERTGYTYRADPDRVDAFMDQVGKWVEDDLLEMQTGPRMGREPWSSAYIRSAYQRGMAQTRARMRREGADVGSFFGDAAGLATAFNQPFHAERVALLYSRAFESLKGVTSAMSAQMGNVLAQGMAEGVGPEEMARRLTDRVDKIGRTRARLIARTETVRAHNMAALAEMEYMENLTGIEVKAQWWTALDDRVRAHHQERHGKVYDRDKAVTMLGEPNCRCSLLPDIEPPEEVPAKPTRRRRAKPKPAPALVPEPTEAGEVAEPKSWGDWRQVIDYAERLFAVQLSDISSALKVGKTRELGLMRQQKDNWAQQKELKDEGAHIFGDSPEELARKKEIRAELKRLRAEYERLEKEWEKIVEQRFDQPFPEFEALLDALAKHHGFKRVDLRGVKKLPKDHATPEWDKMIEASISDRLGPGMRSRNAEVMQWAKARVDEVARLVGGAKRFVAREREPGTLREIMRDFSEDGDRAWANRWTGKLNIGKYVHGAHDMDAQPSNETMWHELGHFVHYTDPPTEMAARDWVQHRAMQKAGADRIQDVPMVRLMDRYPSANYDPTEVAYDGDFIDLYVGKWESTTRSSEVLSMGLQHFRDSESMRLLWEKDPEHFKLTLGTLAKKKGWGKW